MPESWRNPCSKRRDIMTVETSRQTRFSKERVRPFDTAFGNELGRFAAMLYILRGDVDEFGDVVRHACDVLVKFGVASKTKDNAADFFSLSPDYVPRKEIFLAILEACDGGSTKPDHLNDKRSPQRVWGGMSSQLQDFAELVHASVAEEDVHELVEIGPKLFAELALNRWRSLGIVVKKQSGSRAGRYELCKRLRRAEPSVWEIQAVLLSNSKFKCDPATQTWAVRGA
jgi:hypothetical protein